MSPKEGFGDKPKPSFSTDSLESVHCKYYCAIINNHYRLHSNLKYETLAVYAEQCWAIGRTRSDHQAMKIKKMARTLS